MAARTFEAMGAVVEEADPDLGNPWPLIEALWYAGSAAVGAMFSTEARGLMDPGFLRVIEAGERLPLTSFLAAFTGRAATAVAMHEFHRRYDLLLCPTMPIPAFPISRDVPDDMDCGNDPLRWARWSPYTWPFNLTQQPSASIPCGFTTAGLPVGLQITGPMRADALVLRASRAFEAAAPFRKPQLRS
jgi:aspartyl-tRNA(Asn)/glutamyl-tRNA(Gln) amidotransferase subunit A